MICKKCGKRRAKNKRCKFCHRIAVQKNRRSLKGFLRHKYGIIKLRSREGVSCEFTADEFVNWALAQVDYILLHVEWEARKFNKWFTPSVDRIDNAKPYAFDNIQWMTWRDNYRKECIRKGYDPFEKSQPIVYEFEDEETVF